MWMDEEEISKAMFDKCKKNDKKEYWQHITNTKWSYWYCLYMKDRPEVRKNITDPEDAFYYCINIADRDEI